MLHVDQPFRFPRLLLGSVMALCSGAALLGNFSACGGPADDLETDTPVASPPTAFGESIEEQHWSGWHTYQDDMVDMHLMTRVLFFEYRDGLWCGELIVELGEPGSYLAYNLGTGWVTVIDIPADSAGEDVFNLARLYGTLEQYGGQQYSIDAWMDSINDYVPATPSDQTPPMDVSSIFFSAYFQDSSLILDPSDVTLEEFMAYTTDYPHVERTTSIDPATTHIDMPAYPLYYTGPFGSALESDYCAWCMQEGDESTYAPL